MKRMRYSTLRRLTLAVYFLMTIVFCLYLVKLGGDEIDKAERYTTTEKRYVKSLLTNRATLNEVDERYCDLINSLTEKRSLTFSNFIKRFRSEIDDLLDLERERPLRTFMPTSRLREQVSKLYSISKALERDCSDEGMDSAYLRDEDLSAIGETLKLIHSSIQERLNVELDHVENWQNQSLFFFEKLETLLVYFFILTTFFTFIAFLISGHALRRYLGFLSRGAKEISSGNLDYRFNDSTFDLIGEVMRNFDIMAERLSLQTGKLSNINSELRRKAKELEEANLHKDRFLANMSHELRTPLNSIIGFSELIINKSEKLSPEKINEFAGRILSAAEHLLELITDLLEIAKVDAGVLRMEKDLFNLRKVAEEVVEMLRPIADEKNLQLEFSSSVDVLMMNGDRRLIKQVLINLLNNALKFTHQGSVSISISQSWKEIFIEISDTGIGISDDDVRLIFKDFHRVERGLTSKYEGVGLGLTLAKRIVDLHGGVIEVSSELGKGSVFKVVFKKEKQ